MTVSFTHSQTETRMNRCMQRIPTAIRPDKQEFLKNAINSFIDELVRTRVVCNVYKEET